MATLSTGTEVGGYRIEGLLGRGGMGVVYEAVQLSLGRTVALKLLAADLSADDTFRARFRREGRLQAALDHAHIVPVYEAGELGDEGLFIAMRLIRGANLKELIRIRGLDAERTLKILTPVADALDSAHEVDLVHRDVKPQNILVGRRDHAYLADFGLTRAPDDTAFTRTGAFVGTLDYVAPEQIRGEPATARSDIYSLAGVAFECLTGSVPFAKPNEASVLFAHMSEPPPRASDVRPELPRELDAVLARGLAKPPAERYDTALAFMVDLDAALRTARLRPDPAPAPEEAAGTTTLTAGRRGESTVVTGPPSHPDVAAPARVPPAGDAPARESDATPVESGTPVLSPAGPGEPTELHDRGGLVTHADRRRPAAPPAPGPDGHGRRRRATLAVAAAVLVPALAAVAGAALGGSGEQAAQRSPSRSPAPLGTLSSGGLAVRYPAAWREAESVPPVPGLALTKAAALEPAADAASGAIVVGRSAGRGRTLLPRRFLARLDRPPATDDRVRLAGARAYRYDALTVDGAQEPVTLFVAPVTGGVATVACLGAGRDCAGVAGTLRPTGALRALPLGPRAAYARRVGAALGTLRRASARAGRRLREAETAAAQATAARQLAGAYAGLARRLRGVQATPLEADAHPALMGAARRVAAAYRDLAAAATGEQGDAYARARSAVRRGEAAVRARLRSLRALGYEVR